MEKETCGNIHIEVTQVTDEINKIQGLINDASYNDDLELEGKMLNFC